MPRGENPNSKKNLIKSAELSPEERRERARKAGRAPKRRKPKTMKQLARAIAAAPIQNQKWMEAVKVLGITEDEDLVNNAVIIAGLFHAAVEGDLRAIDKWEQYLAPKDKKPKAAAGTGAARDALSQSLMELAGNLTSDPVPGAGGDGGEAGENVD